MTIRRIVVAVAVVALVALTAIQAINALRGPGTVTASQSPSLSASLTPGPSVGATASASASASAAPSPTQSSGVRPDAQHGLIVATGGLRTEDADRSLQNPSLFATAPTTAYAVSPDGKRIALIKGPQLSGQQQIVTFTTARPNDIAVLVDVGGTGEVATHPVWAGDGSDTLLFAVVKFGAGGATAPPDYSAVRTIDLGTRVVREVARIGGDGTQLFPLAWLPARQVVAALEVRATRPIVSYVTIRGGAIERAAITPTPNSDAFSASRDGTRVVLSLATGVRWWSVDQPGAAKDLSAQPGDSVEYAEFRPGADELGVGVSGRFEIWTLTGQRRVVATRVGGFFRWRVDGTAVIASPDPTNVLLVDPVTGATTPLPGGGFPVADVVLF